MRVQVFSKKFLSVKDFFMTMNFFLNFFLKKNWNLLIGRNFFHNFEPCDFKYLRGQIGFLTLNEINFLKNF